MALGLRDSRKCCLRSVCEEIHILQGLLSMPENSFAFLSVKRQIFGVRQIFSCTAYPLSISLGRGNKKAPDNVEGPFNAHYQLQ